MREKIFNAIGLLLLVTCFVVSLYRILFTHEGGAVEDPNKVTIRLAHWQLEGGVRQALDAVVEAYEKLHPNVRILQIPIPERIYTNWTMTQLVGGTAPDIIEIGGAITNEKLTRYFEPLTAIMNQPNPYNKGTSTETTPLRSTFFDGGEGSYSAELFEFYNVPISGFTIRLFYNRALLEKITGSGKLPENYEEFAALAEKVREYNQAHGETIIPVAGSKYNGPLLMQRLFSSQTQKLFYKLFSTAYPNPKTGLMDVALLDGRLSLDSPEIRKGTDLMRAVGQSFQPGFMQVQREDAMFYFIQGRALAIASGSWDASSIRQQAQFPISVGLIPLPSSASPEYGENVIGQISEAGSNAGLGFGVVRTSKNREVALDFLLFAASRPGQQIWTKVSGWLPSVAGVELSPEAAAFKPIEGGYLSGFTLGTFGASDVARVIDSNFNILLSPFGGTDQFLTALKRDMPSAIKSDMQRNYLQQQINCRKADTSIATLGWLNTTNPEDTKVSERLDAIVQAGDSNDRNLYLTRFAMKKSGVTPP